MTGIGAGPETGVALDRAVKDARRTIHELLVLLPAWTADVVLGELRRLERAVEARTREQVAREAEKSGACDCYPNPFDHEDHCPRRNA